MISIFGAMFALFAVIFVISVGFIAAGFLRTHRLARKVFTLAEQELDRQQSANAAAPPAASSSESNCSHCGSRVAADLAQCPNCGAKVR